MQDGIGNMEKKVYSYYICVRINDGSVPDYISDRGIVFAESLKEAVDKVINKNTAVNETIVDIQVFETDIESDDVFSCYIILSEWSEKLQIVNELRDWCIIPER